jgi:glycerophosphoryl diester phosphodiesterase
MSLSDFYDKDRPLVFAHRGAMAYAPMNTIPAFELAAEQGADGIELDVWLSMDDMPVVIHDFELEKSTDGEGTVGSTPFEQLRELDAGGWYDEQYAGERIPTLDEVFEAVGDKVLLNIEVKSTTFRADHIAETIAGRVRDHGMTDRVLVSSFNPFVLRKLKQEAPEIPLGFLQHKDLPFYMSWVLLRTSYEAEHPHKAQVSQGWVNKARRRGRYLNTWTVNDPDEAVTLRDLGVDGIITDAPDVILAALEGR